MIAPGRDPTIDLGFFLVGLAGGYFLFAIVGLARTVYWWCRA